MSQAQGQNSEPKIDGVQARAAVEYHLGLAERHQQIADALKNDWEKLTDPWFYYAAIDHQNAANKNRQIAAACAQGSLQDHAQHIAESAAQTLDDRRHEVLRLLPEPCTLDVAKLTLPRGVSPSTFASGAA